MNLIILADKKQSKTTPLVFIAPDNVDGGALRAKLPKKLQEKYHVYNVDGDQPTPVGSYNDILAFVMEEMKETEDDS